MGLASRGYEPAVRTARAVTSVAAFAVVVTVAVTTIVLSGGVVAGAATGRGRAAPAGRRAAGGTLAVPARVEAPGGGRRSASPLRTCQDRTGRPVVASSYLDLQDVVAADALVVHLMVSIVSVATVLILDEGKSEQDLVRRHSAETWSEEGISDNLQSR